jgi:hypothetical protein
MPDNNYINIKINFKLGNICFTKNENQEDNETPPSPFDIGDNDKADNNLRVEYGIAKVFHKVLNLIKADPDLFQKDDFDLLGEMLSRILFGKINNNLDGRNYALKEIEQKMDTNNPASRRECRIFLEFDQKSNLAMLPWEYTLYKTRSTKETKSVYISANVKSRFHLIRRVMENPCPAADTNKLFVMVFMSLDGNGDAEPPIDSRNNEQKNIKNIFENLRQKNNGKYKDNVVIRYIESTSLGKIKTAVENIYKEWEEEYNESPGYVFHYVGHAMLEKEIGKLVIKDEQTEKAQWVEDQKFAALFSSDKLNVRQPSIVCFQACDSAKVGTIQVGLRGVGYEFTKLHIPAVIGMQNEINVPYSCAFFDIFYTRILEGKDVAEAVTAGRDYLGREHNPAAAAYSSNSFGSPVLFITTEEPITLLKAVKPPEQEEKVIEKKQVPVNNVRSPSEMIRANVQLKEEENINLAIAGHKNKNDNPQRQAANQDIPDYNAATGQNPLGARDASSTDLSQS